MRCILFLFCSLFFTQAGFSVHFEDCKGHPIQEGDVVFDGGKVLRISRIYQDGEFISVGRSRDGLWDCWTIEERGVLDPNSELAAGDHLHNVNDACKRYLDVEPNSKVKEIGPVFALEGSQYWGMLKSTTRHNYCANPQKTLQYSVFKSLKTLGDLTVGDRIRVRYLQKEVSSSLSAFIATGVVHGPDRIQIRLSSSDEVPMMDSACVLIAGNKLIPGCIVGFNFLASDGPRSIVETTGKMPKLENGEKVGLNIYPYIFDEGEIHNIFSNGFIVLKTGLWKKIVLNLNSLDYEKLES